MDVEKSVPLQPLYLSSAVSKNEIVYNIINKPPVLHLAYTPTTVQLKDEVVIANENANPISTRDIISQKDAQKDVSNWYILRLFISLLCYIFDIVTDIHLAYRFFKMNQMNYFYATLMFITIPTYIITLVSICLYKRDNNRVSCKVWLYRVISLILQVSIAARIIESIYYAIKSKKASTNSLKKRYYGLLIKENADIALLQVIESFTESAPQLTLQISILIKQDCTFSLSSSFWYQAASILTSFVNLVWSLPLFNRSVRRFRPDKINMDWPGTIVQFLWYFMITGSRILSIAVLASLIKYSILLNLWIMHWICMVLWLWMDFCPLLFFKKDMKLSQVIEMFFLQAVLGIVYVFIFIPPADGSNKSNHILYYSICLFENCLFVALWIILDYCGPKNCFSVYLIVTIIIMFSLGVIFMCLYYAYFHPLVNNNANREPNLFNLGEICGLVVNSRSVATGTPHGGL